MEILDWAEGNAEKLVQKYLDVEPNEVFSQNELKNKGDYYIGTESSGDGQTMFINVCFGDEFEKHDNNLEKNYEYFTRYAEDISDNMNYDVTVMTNSDDQTIMFQFTDWFPEESEEPKEDYASGGKVKEKVFIEYLNKSKGYKMDRKYFNSYQEAERWARDNFDKFDTDYIRYEYGQGGKLKEEDYVWNALGKKLIVNKVTDDEYYLTSFGQSSSSPFSKKKVDGYIKSGEWSLKPKYAKGGKVDYWGDIDVEARKIYKPIGIYSDAEKEVGAFKEGFIWGKGQEKYDRDLAENEGIKKYKPVGFRNVDRKQAVAFWEGARFADSEKGKKMAEGGELQDEDSLDYNSISDLQSERNRLVRWSNQYGSKGADYKIKKLEERIEYLKSKDSKMADGGELEDDTFVMLFKGYGFVEKRGSYGTKTFYNKEHNAYIYYDPKYRSISGYVGGGEGNDEVIPYSVEGVLDFFIEHDITESESTPFSKGGKVMADGGGVGRIVMIPTYVVKEINDSVKMGYDTLMEGLIGRKRKGVMLVNKDFEVRGTYDIGLKDSIQNIIDKVKLGTFEVDAIDVPKMAKGGEVKNPVPDYPDFVSMQYEKGGYMAKLVPKMDKGGSVQSKYVITYDDGDDISRVWVYARNEEDAQEQAFEEYSDIKEIISVEKMMSDGGMMAKGGELATYKIVEKYKYALGKPKWEDEKFQTGGREFLTFKQAQDIKKKLQGMTSSFEYKVVKVEYADGGMMAKGGEVTFDDKVQAISKKLVGKPVPAPYRKEYGSRYDKEDAQEAARRIVGNMRKLYGE